MRAGLYWIVKHEPGKLPIFTALPEAVPLTEPPEQHIEPIRDGIFVIHNVASRDECKAMIATSEAMGYTEDAPVSLGRDIRKNQSCVWVVDQELNDRVGQRAKMLLNKRWRFYKYQPGDTFKLHKDGAWQGTHIKNGELIHDNTLSWLTFLLYLNDDFEGGTTSFRIDNQTLVVQPRQGSALCFLHGLHPQSFLHQGDIVHSGTKYVARSDVLFPVDET